MFIEGNLQNLNKQQEETRNHKWFHLPEIIVVDTQVVFSPVFFLYAYIFFNKIYTVCLVFWVFLI